MLFAVVREFVRLASALVETAVAGKNAAIIAKDVSWLWRTAYNTALQGCSEWQHAETQIGDLFELSYEVTRSVYLSSRLRLIYRTQLAHTYSRIAIDNTETDVYVHMAHSAFSCVSARSEYSMLSS